jgi:endothelin-converting enzyme/putative endopeptidase
MKHMRIAAAFTLLLIAVVQVAAQGQSPAATDASALVRMSGLDPSFIDKSADPCTDFFQYACGNFAKIHPIPSDHSSFGTFNLLYDNNQIILHSILEKEVQSSASRTANEQKIGDFYASCLDESAINREGLKPLQPELDRIAALRNKSDLTALLAHDQSIGVGAFLSFGEQQDFKDARKQIASVDQGGIGLPERDYYLRTGADDEKIRKQYVEHVANTLKLLGEAESQATANAAKIMQIETALAKVSQDITSQRDPNNVYHIVTVADLQKLSPSIDWKAFIAETGVQPLTDLNVTYLPFFKGLEAVLQSTDLETIKIYLQWRLVDGLPAVMLPHDFDAEHFNFNDKILSGQPEQRPRWKRCVQATDAALGEALGQVYAAQNFPPSSKASTQQMIRDIEAAMNADIDTLDWMSAATKTKAKEKQQAVANKIGYPDKWRDYSNLSVVRGDALGNAVRGTEFENYRELAKIGQPVDRAEFGMSPPTVNAYYNPSMNDINFPAGILQPPFYDSSEPDVVNYGHIGSIEGHELTHGFDDEGRRFDGNGNLAEWWTAGDGKQFEEKADCEVKEYGEFTVPGDVKVNGKLTLGENTADNGGIRLAYMAFLADAKRKSLDLTQKRDGYTEPQQFFLAYAQNWCGGIRPEAERLQAQTDPHAPDRFRANGVVRNIQEFGEAFGCKAGQPMRPVNACRVW